MPLAITVIGDSLVFVRTSKSCKVRVKTILGTSSQAHTQQFSTCSTLQHFSVATATKGKLSGSLRLEWESGNNTVQCSYSYKRSRCVTLCYTVLYANCVLHWEAGVEAQEQHSTECNYSYKRCELEHIRFWHCSKQY